MGALFMRLKKIAYVSFLQNYTKFLSKLLLSSKNCNFAKSMVKGRLLKGPHVFTVICLFFLCACVPALPPIDTTAVTPTPTPTPIPVENNADLSSLIVSSGTLVPAFSTGITEYSMLLANSVSKITVTGIPASNKATISANSGVEQDLEVGHSTMTLEVIAQDGITSKEYTVKIDRIGDYTSAHINLLKYIPAGQFHRTSPSSNLSIIDKGFRICSTEITRLQFNNIMGYDPSVASSSSGTGDPVQNVSWYRAIIFCNKLSIAENLQPVYSVSVNGVPVNFATLDNSEIPNETSPVALKAAWNGAVADWTANGYRLPTEMEWKWAALGGQDDWDKPFAGSNGSNSIGAYAWYTSNSNLGDGKRTHAVGVKSANEFFLYDMSGNVMEWCWDWYADSYPSGTIHSDTVAGKGLFSGSHRIIRGGSWIDLAYDCTLDFNSGAYPEVIYDDIGFRVVRN
jgi:formylglycine-generating enzyme required for sulfatase activity